MYQPGGARSGVGGPVICRVPAESWVWSREMSRWLVSSGEDKQARVWARSREGDPPGAVATVELPAVQGYQSQVRPVPQQRRPAGQPACPFQEPWRGWLWESR